VNVPPISTAMRIDFKAGMGEIQLTLALRARLSRAYQYYARQRDRG
jgi:hypothetical protein